MKFLQIQKLCFYSFGYSFRPNESVLLRFYALLSIALLLGVSIPEAHFAVVNSSDIELVTDTLATLLTCILTLTKLTRLFFRRSKLYEIVLELEDMWMKASNEDKPFLEKGSVVDNRLTCIYFISAVATGTIYLITPIIKAITEMKTTGNATWIQPMRSVFIYDTTVSPNYELTYLWFCQGTYLSVFGSVGVDCLFYGCAFNIASHFEIVQQHFSKTKFEIGKLSSGNIHSQDNFLQTIRYHQKLLRMCKEFSALFAPILFIQFSIIALQICVIGYQLTIPNLHVVDVASRAFFLATMCFQCYTYCNAGSQLTAESFGVSNALYGSQWYESSVAVKKIVGIALIRAQKPFVVYSGFYEANLDTFSNILKAAGSYITILQSLQDG